MTWIKVVGAPEAALVEVPKGWMDKMHWIYPDIHLGAVRMNGAVTGMDVVKELCGLYRDPAWQRGYDTLWDARNIEMLDFSLLDLSTFREQSTSMMEAQGTGRIAVAVRREVVYDIARLLLLTRQRPGREARVFWSLEEALAWLGIADTPSGL